MKTKEEKIDLIVDGVSMPSVLTMPFSGLAVANILLIPGSLFNDVDGNYPHMNIFPHAYADLSNQLAAKGYNVLRYAKHGPGTDSVILDKTVESKHGHFSERMVVARAALYLLQKNTSENCPTFIAGHSEGSLVAFILAQNLSLHIDGVISLSGPAYRFFDLMINQAITRDEKSGKIDEDNWRQMRNEFDLVRQGKAMSTDAFSNPNLVGFAHLDPIAWQYLLEMDAIDPILEIRKIKQPVLLIQGGLDESVFAENAEKLKENRGALTTKLVFFENLQHFYKPTNPDMNTMESFALSTISDLGVSEAIDEWIKQLNIPYMRCKL